MAADSELILHVGMPKGGSSALQAALSQTPDLETASGRRLRYLALRGTGTNQSLLRGDLLRLSAEGSVYGYVTWPSLGGEGERQRALFASLEEARQLGGREGFVPILSNEGWISHPQIFARGLAELGHPPVEVVAYLRPPVDWVNAAYWQWGVWHAPNIGTWLASGQPRFHFGAALEDWARIPGVRLRLGGFRPDVVEKFAHRYGVGLCGGSRGNSSSSPALLGFLLRNREFRPSGHDPAVEFVVQRWCPPVPGRRLWAVRRKHLHDLRPTVRDTREALSRIGGTMGPEMAADLADIFADPHWQEEAYEAEIARGPSPLDDREELAGLHAALRTGLERATEAAGLGLEPGLPGGPPPGAGLEQWDAALAPLLRALLRADTELRRAAWNREARALVGRRGRSLLSRVLKRS